MKAERGEEKKKDGCGHLVISTRSGFRGQDGCDHLTVAKTVDLKFLKIIYFI